MDSTLTAYKVALWWTILCMNRHDTLTKTLIRNSLTVSDLFHSMNCQEYRPPSKTKDPTQGCLERTPYHIVFRGPRCLVFMQLDPDHPGSPPFCNKVYFISNLVPRVYSAFKMAAERRPWHTPLYPPRNRGVFCHVTHNRISFSLHLISGSRNHI